LVGRLYKSISTGENNYIKTVTVEWTRGSKEGKEMCEEFWRENPL